MEGDRFMNEYDVILEYTSCRDLLVILVADSMLAAAHKALDEAIFYKDLKYIASIEVVISDDKEKICKH